MARDLRSAEIVEQVRAFLAGLQATELSSLSLKVIDSGEFRPVPSLAAVMNQIVVYYAGFEGEWDRNNKAYQATHDVRIEFFRLLGETEQMNTGIVTGGQLIANQFIQGRFDVPFKATWPHEDAVINFCAPASGNVEPGFSSDDGIEVELYSIALKIGMSHY